MFLISHELHKFSRNKDCKKLFTLHYLTNFHLTVNYFVNILLLRSCKSMFCYIELTLK